MFMVNAELMLWRVEEKQLLFNQVFLSLAFKTIEKAGKVTILKHEAVEILPSTTNEVFL